jgi:tRNA-modifying protein YgfZ
MTVIDPDKLHTARLPHLGALHVAGADARAFLQGQLSADIDALTERQAVLASCNSAQGRVQAVMWLAARADGVALVLPARLIEQVAARLRKYVLRAKATVDAERLEVGVAPAQPFEGLTSERSHAQAADVSFLRLPGHTQLAAVAPSGRFREADEGAALIWRREGVAAGLPNVYPETYEAFVAQMLNLDLLSGISFAKGCYTGQEIIARTHYRGAIKRRMFRFQAACESPAPGSRILAGEQHAGDVVDSAPVEGGCELLAVVSLAHIRERLRLEVGAELTRLPLPYEVPDAV